MKSSWIRKVLIALLALVLMLAAALTWLVSTFDANAYKGLAVNWVKTHRDRTLAIDGPVKLSVFPRLSVQLSDVSLSEKGSADEFAALNQVSLSVRLLPLLRKQVAVDRVSARGLRMVYRRDARGHANIDDLLDKNTPPAPEEARNGEGKALRLDIRDIALEDLRLSVRDEMTKVSGEIGLQSLKTGRLADGVESPIELDAQLALKSPAVQGRLTGKTRMTMDLPAAAFQLRDTRLTWLGNAFGVRELDLALQGSLAANGRDGTLQADDLELKLGANLGATRLSNSRLGIQTLRLDPRQKRFELRKMQLHIAGTQGGHPLALSLDWPALSVKGAALSGSALSGTVSLQGPQAFKGSFQSAAPVGDFDRIKVPAFETRLSASNGPREFNGLLRADLLHAPAARSVALEGLKGQWKIQEPSLQPLALELQGRAQASAQAAQWGLSGNINSNPFQTEGRLNFNDTPMSLQLNASFKALDLNRLLPKSTPTPASASASGSTSSNPVIDLSPLNALQGRFSVRIGEFAHEAYRIRDAELDATLQSGVLRASRLSGKSWGGTLDATLTADARNQRIAVKGTAQGVDINALLKDVAHKDLLEGTGRVGIDLDMAGRTVNDMKSRLQGSATLQLRDGAVKGLNLARTLRRARAAMAQNQDARQTAAETEKTDFSEMAASFTVRDGVAHNSDLALKSPFLRVGGDGNIDIAKSRIDYTVRATVAETSKGQDGAELAALKGLTVPVRLTGPLDAIEWTVQWSAVAANVLKSEVGTRLQDRLKEKLGERLGGPPGPADDAASAPRPKEVLKEKLLKELFKNR